MEGDMIERVARAIYDGQLRPGGGGNILLPYEAMKDRYVVMARAAIEAMREPTIEMWRRASYGKLKDGMWRAMIDAALAPAVSGKEE